MPFNISSSLDIYIGALAGRNVPESFDETLTDICEYICSVYDFDMVKIEYEELITRVYCRISGVDYEDEFVYDPRLLRLVTWLVNYIIGILEAGYDIEKLEIINQNTIAFTMSAVFRKQGIILYEK
jgi:hypothetical protein